MHPFFQRFHDLHRSIHHRHHLARHSHRGFGFDPAHGFDGDPLRSDGGIRRGRKLGSADLQLLLLALLAERPSHGYELIKALDERSKGFYSPSPGMVYPALTYLEEIGHASVETQGTKKLYTITDAGRAHLEAQRAAADALLAQLAWAGEHLDGLRRAMTAYAVDDVDLTGDDRAAGGWRGGRRGRHDDAGAPDVREARRRLKSALVDKSGAPPDEQRRIAAILERAAAEIRGE